MFEDPERYVEADTVARAFASLSPRWQQTLWLTEVEQRSPAEVAAHLHLAPNATAALTHRAREAFATAYLAEHIDSAPHDACERYAPRLAAYVRDQLTDSQRDDVERHLVDCQRCQQAVNDLRDVNASLRKLASAGRLGSRRTVDRRHHHARHGVGPVQLRAAAQGRDAPARRDPAAVLNVTGGSRGGDTTDDDDVRTVVAAPLDVDAEMIRSSPRHVALACQPFTDGSGAGTTTTTSTAVVEPARPGPTLGAEPSRSATLPIDDVASPGRPDVVLDPVIDEVVDPVVDDVVVPVVEDVVRAGGRSGGR